MKTEMERLPTVKVTYGGKPLTERYFREHPEIHHLYPTRETFMARIYLPILQKMQETKEDQVLEISENKIKFNGVEQSLG